MSCREAYRIPIILLKGLFISSFKNLGVITLLEGLINQIVKQLELKGAWFSDDPMVIGHYDLYSTCDMSTWREIYRRWWWKIISCSCFVLLRFYHKNNHKSETVSSFEQHRHTWLAEHYHTIINNISIQSLTMCKPTQSQTPQKRKLEMSCSTDSDIVIDTFAVPTIREKPLKTLDVDRITSDDLAALKTSDPFMYYSIPSIREAELRCESVNISTIIPAADGSRARADEGKVTRQTRVSFECSPAKLILQDFPAGVQDAGIQVDAGAMLHDYLTMLDEMADDFEDEDEAVNAEDYFAVLTSCFMSEHSWAMNAVFRCLFLELDLL